RRAADRIVAGSRKHKRVLRGLQFAAEDRPADEIHLFIRAGNQHQAGAGIADRRALDDDAGAGARRQDAGGINEIALDEEDAAAGRFHLAGIDPGDPEMLSANPLLALTVPPLLTVSWPAIRATPKPASSSTTPPEATMAVPPALIVRPMSVPWANTIAVPRLLTVPLSPTRPEEG